MSVLEKKTVLLTGASMGIGRAVAMALATRGARLVLNARGVEALGAVAAECRDLGAECLTVAGDCGTVRVVDKLRSAARRLGGADMVLHAAGMLAPGPSLEELTPTDFDAVWSSGPRAAWLLMRALAAQLRRSPRGLLVAFGSGAAEITQPGIAAYCAAKAAEEHLVRQFTAEEPDVVSFVFRPGVVETRMHQHVHGSQGRFAPLLREVFAGMKVRGDLISPERAAKSLLELLERDPAELRGKTFRAS